MAAQRFRTHKDFPEENVSVDFPGQARPIQALKDDIPSPLPPGVPGVFLPFRPVINLKMADASDPKKEVSEFDPPIEVRVRIHAPDVAMAEKLSRPLCLGFWDGKQWIRITPEKHSYHTDPDPLPGSGGWAIFKISHWGDPPIAVGT